MATEEQEFRVVSQFELFNKSFPDDPVGEPCDNGCMSTPKHPKRPADVNRRAFQVVQEATRDAPPPIEPTRPESTEKPPEREKDPAAVALGRKGGLKGGKARVSKMTQEERTESARHAANTRWRKNN